MQTIYAFGYNPALATGTNTTGTNWRMAYRQPLMLYKGVDNVFRIVVFSVTQQVVNLTNYMVQVQLVDKEAKEEIASITATIDNPINGVATVTITSNILDDLQNRFYHVTAKLINDDAETEILYLDDNYGAFLPVTMDDGWNFSPAE